MTIYNAISAPDAAAYPNVARWYKHIASHQAEFETLPGDKSSDISKYGPEVTPAAVNPAAAPAAEEDSDEEDLFASDDEEESAEKAALTAKRLAEYHAKKAQKPANSMFFTAEISFENSLLTIIRSCQVYGHPGRQALGR